MPSNSDDNDDASAPRAVVPRATAPGSLDGLLDAIVALRLAGRSGDSLFGPAGSIPKLTEQPLPPALRTLGLLIGGEPQAWTVDP